MKNYMDTNTGELYTEDELNKLFEQFKWEMLLHYDSFEDYIDDMVRKGNLKEI